MQSHSGVQPPKISLVQKLIQQLDLLPYHFNKDLAFSNALAIMLSGVTGSRKKQILWTKKIN